MVIECDEPDAALVSRATAGDRAAFGVLLERHRPGLVHLCWRLLAGNPELAEDCAQDACLLAMLSLHHLRQPALFGAWLRGIGVRCCRREVQRRSSQRTTLAHLPETAPSTGSEAGSPYDGAEVLAASPALAAIDESDLAQTLWCAVRALPTGQRDAVTFFYIQDLPYEAAATSLGIPTGALKTRLHKAREALRRQLSLAASFSAPGTAAAPRHRRQTLAIHEAGHAVLFHVSGGQVRRIAIAPVSGVQLNETSPGSIDNPGLTSLVSPGHSADDADSSAHTINTGDADGAQRARSAERVSAAGTAQPHPATLVLPPRDALQSLMGGDAARALQDGRRSFPPTASDHRAALVIALDLTGGDEVEAALIVEQARQAACNRLMDYRTWSLVQCLAGALLERARLDGDDLRVLLAR